LEQFMNLQKSAVAMSLALACAVSLQSAISARAEIPHIDSATDVLAEHAIAQQGLAIALASNVLQSHLLYVAAALGYEGGPSGAYGGACQALDSTDNASGGIEAQAPTPPPGTIPPVVHVTIFYDGACTRKYMKADVSVQQSDTDTYSVNNLVTHYFATDAATPLATLVSTASATLGNTTISLHGLGSLVGQTGQNVAASLGLVCTNQVNGQTDPNNLYCAGGIVQDFKTLGAAIGSVSPLTLFNATNGSSLTFASTTPAAFRSGAVGSLSLKYTDGTDSVLAISGGGVYGSDDVSGEAAQFSLFPPPPTDWHSDDSAHDAHFSISVLSPTVRNLGVVITRISTGATRATASLDQSGSGTITFSDGSRAEIRGWVMSDGPPDEIFADGFEAPYD
jgi:hypothetical protein